MINQTIEELFSFNAFQSDVCVTTNDIYSFFLSLMHLQGSTPRIDPARGESERPRIKPAKAKCFVVCVKGDFQCFCRSWQHDVLELGAGPTEGGFDPSTSELWGRKLLLCPLGFSCLQ